MTPQEQPEQPDVERDDEPQPEPEPTPDEGSDDGQENTTEGDAPDAPEPEPEAKSKPKPKAKAKVKPAHSEKDDKAAMRSEWESIERVVAQGGSRSRDRKRIKELAKALNRKTPEWAEGKDGSGKGGSDKPSRADDPDLQLAHAGTALATKGSVKEGRVELGDVKFGAAVNSTQVREMRERLKGKNVLQFLGGVSERKLKEYAQGDAKLADLPDETKAALKELNRTFDPKLKMWARKSAVIAYTIHKERAKGSKKPAAKKAEPVAA